MIYDTQSKSIFSEGRERVNFEVFLVKWKNGGPGGNRAVATIATRCLFYLCEIVFFIGERKTFKANAEAAAAENPKTVKVLSWAGD